MTETSIGQRLKLEMKQRGITSTDLARRSEVKTSFIYDVLSGKSANPSTLKLARVARTLGISLSSLASAGELLPSEYTPIPRITVEASIHKKRITLQEQTAESYSFRSEWISQRLAASPAELRMIYHHGDGMEPSLQQGDLMMINTSRRTPSPSGIFVLFDGTKLMTRRLELRKSSDSGQICVQCDNPQYAAYERSPEEIYIIGRVVWFAREI